ncbi:hypothetical protein CD351_14070 [Erythrobacter sp. KY5]|uniref:XdhC family protein n=1 Tax=Erythrobacter sp. KY5 TaxID=2011159 RepID=UPI000DBEF663|nr:XdhC family protein [Erythrobacter sp. KY5]AWW75559.1 hypothetical protein CD351_14070 [Erythrobacter sp. KY5]
MDIKQVCQFLAGAIDKGQRCVLVTVVAVEGSSMRNPGTIMGVAEDGSFEGSLSGGCIENAVVAEARRVFDAGAARIVRFGAGSPYLDIKLPCGGGLDLHFQPLADAGLALECLNSIAERSPFSIRLGPDGARHVSEWMPATFDAREGTATFGHWPQPLLQIVGHGAGVEALAVLGRTHGCSTRILTPDERMIGGLTAQGIEATLLERTSQTDLLASDRWTATIFLFHDHDWEIDLMRCALEQPHFYLGAMGGRKAHAFRTDALSRKGLSDEALSMIRAPIGLFHSSRDPRTLALSTLGEVIRTYEETRFENDLG